MKPKSILGSLFVLFVLASCSSSPKDQPVSEAEATVMASKIDSAINNKKAYVFNDLFNVRMFTERIAKHSGNKVNTSMIEGVKKGLRNANLGDQIIRSTSNGGSYKLVKQYEKDQVWHLLFRMYSDDGLNYHDFELTKRDGQTYISDIYIYLVGDNFSAVMADLMKTMTGSIKADGGNEDKVVKSLQRVKSLMSEGKLQQAKKYYDDLPADIRDDKLVRIVGITLASNLGNDDYLEALEDFKKHFPNEPNIYLLLIDANILREEYAEALTSINKLDNLIDKDPFLDYFRALVLKMMGEKEQATQKLEALHTNMPDFGSGTVELIADYLDNKEEEKARALVKEYRSNKEFKQEILTYILMQYPSFDEEVSEQTIAD